MLSELVFTLWRETWADAVRRQFMPPDRLAHMLLRHQGVKGLIVAEPFRSGPMQAARALIGRRRKAPFPESAATRLVAPRRFRRDDGVGRRALEQTYADYDQRLRAEAVAMGLNSPAMITTNPFYAAYAPLDWTGPVTYYAWDDWTAQPTLKKWWPDLHAAYSQIKLRGHRVCAVSRPLLEVLDPSGPGLVVPNGIDPSEWAHPWSDARWFTSLPAPRILYAGALEGRLDLRAIREISEAFPEGSLVFVGPTIEKDVVAQLKSFPNVHVRDAVPRKQIAGLIHSADVCVMPHVRNDLTNSMSPLKIYEYCAAGRPIAATDLSPVRNIHSAVNLVSEGGSFADAVT